MTGENKILIALPVGPCDCEDDAPDWPDFEQKFKDRFPDGVKPANTPFMEMLRRKSK